METFTAYLKSLDENKDCYISGDFNLDLLKHETNSTINDFLNAFYNSNLRPLIDRPTRITPTSATLIDNIFSNVLTNSINAGIFVTGLTDHYPVFQITKHTPFNHRHDNNLNRNSRLFNQQRIDDFYNHLNIIDWNSVLSSNSCEFAYYTFISKFLNLYDTYFPYRSLRSDSFNRQRIPRKPWITSAIMKSISRKEKLHNKFVNRPNETNKNNYHNYRNRLTTIIRASKRDYYAKKLSDCKHNTKQTWNVLNSILGRNKKTSLPDSFKHNDEIISDPQQITNKFNSYFINIGPKLANQINSFDNYSDFLKNIRSPTGSLFLSPTSSDEVIKLCMSLKSGASSGHDEIKPDIVKAVRTIIAAPLAHIFNLSMYSGVVPGQFKIARVIPIFKNGEHHDITNYRPISVLPVFSKILERLVHNRLYRFMSRFNLLHNSQFGFRPNFSSALAIMEAYTKIVANLDKKKHTLGIFLDLSKAFDTINHNILLSKLSHYGIRGSAFEWFKNYLADRHQFVSYNGGL